MNPRKKGPRCVRHKSAERCGKGVVWCGHGSQWDNPWRARQTERAVAYAVQRAHVQFNDPPWTNAGSMMHGPRAPSRRERALALAALFRVWIEGRVSDMPQHLRVAIIAATSGGDGAPAFGAPPSVESIRTALRGRSLADSAPRGEVSHVYSLIQLANAPEPPREATAA